MYSHKRVLVALDGSTACEAVLRFLLQIAGPLDMTVLILHVLEPIPPQVTEGTQHLVVDDVEARRREAEEYLAPIAAALRSQGVDTAWAIRRGRPADEILDAARESGADLIAMATHGRTGIGRLLFGSVAEAVLRRARVPVFMIREPHIVEAAPGAKEESVR
jgi:nucleotide-binding universal stress UspA family protein